MQLFAIEDIRSSSPAKISQLTDGMFDVNHIIGIIGSEVFAMRSTHQIANEIYSYNTSTKAWKQITHENDETYKSVSLQVPKKDG